MRAIIITGGLLLLAVAGVQAMVSRSTAKTEERPYRVIQKDGDFEIRYYPECIMASVEKSGSWQKSQNNGFRDLAGYIFGGNEASQSIAMTSPVLMDDEGDDTTMSFVMPSEYEMEDLPNPNNKNIDLHKVPAMYAATLRWGGFTKDGEFEKKSLELKAKLKKLELKSTEHFVYMGYNPPYQLINRRNEVLVELIDFTESTEN